MCYDGGPAENGDNRGTVKVPMHEYLQQLEVWGPERALHGLATAAQSKGTQPFELNWDFMKTVNPKRTYFAQWSFMQDFPHLAKELRMRQMWPSSFRTIFPHMFCGPHHTVTGLHYDWHDNFFCQV